MFSIYLSIYIYLYMYLSIYLSIRWFAERADRIILLFDAHKLDISDEFKSAIEAIKPQEDKVNPPI